MFLGEGCQVLGAAGWASMEGAIFWFEKMQQKAESGFAAERPGPQPCIQLPVVCPINWGVSTQICSTGRVPACCLAVGLPRAAPAPAERLAEPWREPNKPEAASLPVPLLLHGCQAAWAQAWAGARAGEVGLAPVSALSC